MLELDPRDVREKLEKERKKKSSSFQDLGCRFQICRYQQQALFDGAVIVYIVRLWRFVGVYGSPHS